jgi:hypothetical protein
MKTTSIDKYTPSYQLQVSNEVTGYDIFNLKAFLPLTDKVHFLAQFREFGHAIVNAISVLKFMNFLWTCGIVVASRLTNFSKIPICGDTTQLKKHIFIIMWVAHSLFIKNFSRLVFFSSIIYKVLKHIMNFKKFYDTSNLLNKCWKINYIVSKNLYRELWILQRCT